MNTTKRFISVLALALALYGSPALAQSDPEPTQALTKPLVFLSGTGETHTASSLGIFGNRNSISTQHDQTMEMTKDFIANCPGVTLTIKQDSANYTVALNHEYNNHSQMMIAGADGAVLMTDDRGANILVGRVGGTSVKAKIDKACIFIIANWGSGVQPVKPVSVPKETPKAAPQPVVIPTPVAQATPAAATIDAPAPEESLGDIARRYKKTNPNAQQRQ